MTSLRFSTSLRERPAAETWRLAAGAMGDLGISRVTDVTRIDRLGLPVCISVRPRGRTLRVHAGKALGTEEARVGAAMEAIEYALAERASAAGPELSVVAAELIAGLPHGLRLADFAPRMGVLLPEHQPVGCMWCEDLVSGGRAALPAEVVLMPCPPDDGPVLFGWSTNGLASGNSLEEATVHALLEVLERDALAMNAARDDSSRVPNERLPAPFAELAARWRSSGIELFVGSIPNPWGLPCFEAHLHEAANASVTLAGGSGLHVDPFIAVSRAICEAAQSRLSVIHGGRDDIVQFYARSPRLEWASRQRSRARVLAMLQRARPETAPDWLGKDVASGPGHAQLLETLLARLVAAGFPTVFRRRMGTLQASGGADGLHVVRVVVPGCAELDREGIRMGPRLLARVTGRG